MLVTNELKGESDYAFRCLLQLQQHSGFDVVYTILPIALSHSYYLSNYIRIAVR